MNDVIVLLPGITGSELRKGGAVVWGWSGRALTSNILTGGRKLLDDLWGNSNEATADDESDGVTASQLLPDFHTLPGFWKIDGYGRVADTLTAAFGLRAGENFLPFPYDWRRDNRVAARRLKRETDDLLFAWRTKSGSRDAKLILIGHSMGGLVSRYFLEVLEGWRDTRALITFGTPFRGSLNAVDALANGLKLFGLLDLSAFAQRLTSLHQLLPIYPCVDGGDGSLKRVTEVAVPNLDATKAADALAFHNEIRAAVEAHGADDAYRNTGYKTYPIVGVNQPTNQSARVDGARVAMIEAYENDYYGGDGTVPRASAMPAEQKDAASGMFAATKHAALQNADAVLPHLVGLIESLYLDLGQFLRPTNGLPLQLALHIDDVYRLGEKIDIRAKPIGGAAALEAIFHDVESGAPFGPMPLIPGTDEWQFAEFAAPRAGAYRVSVTSDVMLDAVTDVFEVV